MTVLGCDISHWQGTVDFNKMKAAGAKFVIMKASEGASYIDTKFNENYDASRYSDLLLGAYHFVQEVSANAQLDLILKVIENKKLDLPFVLDCECKITDGKLMTSIIQNLTIGLQNVNISPIIYTRQNWWDPSILKWSGWSKLPLWAARYFSNAGAVSPWADGYYKFRDWTNWTLWQWSADGNKRGHEFGCTSTDIDLDYFNGSYDDLLKFCGKEVPEPPPPTPNPCTGWAECMDAWARALGYNGPKP
jgi:lysozyme